MANFNFTVTPNTTEINVGEVIIFTISNTIGYKYRIYCNDDIIEENTITSTHTLQYTFLDAGTYNITAKEFDKTVDSWKTISNVNITITVSEPLTGSWSINNKIVKNLQIGNKTIQTIERVSDGAIIYKRTPVYEISLVSDKTSVEPSETVTFTAILTYDNQSVSGETVTFTDGTNTLGTSTTNASGVATLTYSWNTLNNLNIKAIYNNIESNALNISVEYPPLIIQINNNRFAILTGLGSKGLTGSNMVIDWDDGTTEQLTSGTQIPSHSYSTTGTYNIKVTGNITGIGDYGLYTGSSINPTYIYIPNGVTTIGTNILNYSKGNSISIPKTVSSISPNAFKNSSLVDYQLYWNNPPVTWRDSLMPNNTNTYYTIPHGTTANYVAKSFPSAKLIERSS